MIITSFMIGNYLSNAYPMKNLKSLTALLACLITGSAAAASVSTHFDITVQTDKGEPQIFRVDLGPKASIRQAMRDNLTLEVKAPEEESGEGRSELRLLWAHKDGSYKVLHIAGIATFRNEAVQASYGMCGGRAVYRSDIAPGVAVCE